MYKFKLIIHEVEVQTLYNKGMTSRLYQKVRLLPCHHEFYKINMLSKRNETIIIAVEKGYLVTREGNAIGIRGKILTPYASSTGYCRIGVTRYDKTSTLIDVHRLQAYQKFGNKIFDKNIYVRHLNGNPLDNSWDNITIGSPSDNQMDIPKHERILRSSHPKHDHKAILADHKNGMSYNQIMKKYNISSKGTVSFIVNKSLVKD